MGRKPIAEWKIFCGKCLVTAGTKFVAIVELVLIAGTVIYTLFSIINRPVWPDVVCGKLSEPVNDGFCQDLKQSIDHYDSLKYIFYACLALNLLQMLATLLLIMGVIAAKPLWVLPHLGMQFVTLIFLIVYAVVLGLNGDYFVIILVTLLILVEMVFLYIVIWCYKYLKFICEENRLKQIEELKSKEELELQRRKRSMEMVPLNLRIEEGYKLIDKSKSTESLARISRPVSIETQRKLLANARKASQ